MQYEIEKGYSELFDTVTEAIYIQNEKGEFLDVNRGAEKMYGYLKEELIGKTPAYISAPGKNDLPTLVSIIEDVFSSGKTAQFEFWGIRKNGEIFLKDVILQKGFFLGKTVIIATARDITSKKEDERLLKRNSERLEKLGRCLSSLRPDHQENIDRLTALAGELLDGSHAFFNRLQNGLLYTIGQWNCPALTKTVDHPEGHICYDLINQQDEELKIIQHLKETPYHHTDPIVKEFGIQTYFGQVVKCAGERIGSLCIVYNFHFVPSEEDQRLLGIIASSMGFEFLRKQNEEILYRNESKFRSLFEDSAVSIFEEDFSEVKKYLDQLQTTGVENWREYFDAHPEIVVHCASLIKVTDINNECLKLFKIKDKSAILKLNYTNFTPETWAIIKEELIALADGHENFISELPVRDFEGNNKQVIFKLKVSPESKATLERVIISMIDITEWKRSERIQQVLYAITDAVNSTKDLVELLHFIKSEVGKLVDTTNFFVAFYHQETDTLTSPFFSDEHDTVSSWPAKYSATGYVVRSKRSMLLTEDLVVDLKRRGILKNIGHPSKVWVGVPLQVGDVIFGAMVVQSYSNPHAFTQKDLEILEFVSDQISIAIQRKQAEEEIIALNQTLEQRVEVRTQELEASNRNLEAFAYSVSHDLRSPLRAINGFTKILVENYSDKFDDYGLHLCATIQAKTNQMNQLIEDLLQYSRFTRFQLEKILVKMNDLVTMACQEVLQQHPESKVVFEIEALPSVYVDQTTMSQVWINLISNAVKFSSKKGNPQIKISCKSNDIEDVFTITDNGEGFDMDYAHKLFGVFQRLHSSSQFEGTGVGLAIVYNVIQRHGGRVWAESVLSESASFHFSLPRID